MATQADTVKSLSPRVRQALRMYATAQAPTKKAAAEAMGLTPNYISMLTAKNPLVNEFLANTQEELAERTINVGALLNKLSIRALDTIATTMESGSTELLRFKAAQDLADRGPQTMKSSRLTVDGGLVIATADAKALADAMVAAAEVRATYLGQVTAGSDDQTGSFIENV